AYDERLSDGGKVLDNSSGVWVIVQRIVIEAKLAEPKKSKRGRPYATGISPHVFRHTAATHMVRRGVPIYIVAAVLGNSVKMIAEVYGHHAKDDLQAAVDTISGGMLEAAE
ncbi:MAG: site-specific integrase, partial [Mesorhizobium sp.]